MLLSVLSVLRQIIKRARQNYLYQPFIEAHPHLSEDLLLTLQNAWNQYFEKKLASLLSPKQHAADHKNEVVWVSSDWEYIQQQVESDPEWIEKNTSKPPKVDEAKMHVKTLNTSRKGILAAQANLKNTLSQDSAETLSATQDIIKEWLDQEVCTRYSYPAHRTITNKSNSTERKHNHRPFHFPKTCNLL